MPVLASQMPLSREASSMLCTEAARAFLRGTATELPLMTAALAGLRAKEIAALTLANVCDDEAAVR